MNELLAALSVAIEYDSHLRHILEATEALIKCGLSDKARLYAAEALSQARQMRCVRRLHDWIVMFQKSVYIARELKMGDFVRNLFSHMSYQHFKSILAIENNSVSLAYAYSLRRSLVECQMYDFERAVTESWSAILQRARREPLPAYRAIALVLAEAPEEELTKSAQCLDLRRPWEWGLASLLYDSINPCKSNPFVPAPDTAGWAESLQVGISEHVTNLVYGLTLRAAISSQALGEQLAMAQQQAAVRARDELVGAKRWLLEQHGAPQKPHYIWVYLMDTVLRPTYLDWEDRVNQSAFGQLQLAVAS